jgi:hypothetical protein
MPAFRSLAQDRRLMGEAPRVPSVCLDEAKGTGIGHAWG